MITTEMRHVICERSEFMLLVTLHEIHLTFPSILMLHPHLVIA
jgi:hypothetical protein